MFTLVGFSESQDSGGVLVYVAGLPDQHVSVVGDNITVPAALPFLSGVLAVGTTITGARVEAPSLYRVALPDIVPLNVGAEPIFPLGLMNRFYAPIPLIANEFLRFLASEGAAGAERETGLVWLSDGPLTPVGGESFTIMATGTTTLAAYAWTNVPLTFSQALPAGDYQVVGMSALSAGCIAARLVFRGTPWRPGCVGIDAIGDTPPEVFRAGGLGVWGEFSHNNPPSVEFLSVSADSSETVWLDVVRI